MDTTRRVRAVRLIAILGAFLWAGSTGHLSASMFASQQANMTNQEVIQMVKAGLSPRVIIASIEAAKTTRFDVQPTALISLKQAGVPDSVVEAMIVASSPKASSSGGARAGASNYTDGYKEGWYNGDKFRRSGRRYNPDDIILPGIMVQQMTVKLGSEGFDKWHRGYQQGYEDGRLGRPANPTEGAPQSSEKREPSDATKAAVAAARKRSPGASVYAVGHDHGLRSGFCEGYLVVSKTGLTFKGVNASRPSGVDIHEFEATFSEVKEVGRTGLLNVKLRDGKNYNFDSPSAPIDEVLKAVLAVAPQFKR